MKSKRLDLVRIKFLDHVSTTGGLSEPIECTLYGIIVGQDKNAYYVASWLAGAEVDQNSDTHTILKKVVKKLTRIRKEKIT